MDAVDIHSVYMPEIDKVTSNPRDSRHHDASNPCNVCVNTGHTFDECEILKNMTF